jgi:hypothetical protein
MVKRSTIPLKKERRAIVRKEAEMDNVLHATFETEEDGVRAVEGLLHHGLRPQDIHLILPEPHNCDDAKALEPAEHHVHEAVQDAEEGAGIGLGFGLIAAMCVPGLSLIAGSGIVIASIMAAGAAVGGVAGGVYGYLIDRGADRATAGIISKHLKGGGTAINVTLSDMREKGEIVRILREFNGQLIR